MAIIVEHEKRKREILDKALDIFTEKGFEDVTFQKIADRCGITRTTLYTYFRNKREIFSWSIKQLTNEIEASLLRIIHDESLSIQQRLEIVLENILEKCAENHRLFTVTLTYLLQLKKSGKDPAVRVRRRTLRLRHILSTLIIEGINSGEFRDINVRDINELLYSIIEASIFRLAVLNQKDISELQQPLKLAIQGIVVLSNNN